MRVKIVECPSKCGGHFEEELASLKPGHAVRCSGCRAVCIIQEDDMPAILDRLSKLPPEGTA